MKYPRVLQAVYGRAWLIDRDFFDEVILPIADLRALGMRFTRDEIDARLAEARERNGQGERRAEILAAAATSASPDAQGRRVAVIPVLGPITRRMSLMSDTSGGTSIDGLRSAFREALMDGSVSGIVFAVDSPGGTVEGIEEFAAEIRAARGRKPIAAVADANALSAAYYIASAAQELVVTPSGQVGSVGVLFAHRDETKAEEMAGYKTTFIYAGRFKAEGRPETALTEEAVAHYQSQADEYYRMFVNAVAAGRGVSAERVRETYGEGRTVLARQALELGMVDRIDTLDNTIARVAQGALIPHAINESASATAEAGLLTDPEVAAAEEIVATATKHAAARATEGRPLSAADRARLEALRESIDGLLARSDVPAEPTTPRRTVLDLIEAMAVRGYPIPPLH